jgi:hypothetical protein
VSHRICFFGPYRESHDALRRDAPAIVTKAMKQVEAKIACAANVQQVSVN